MERAVINPDPFANEPRRVALLDARTDAGSNHEGVESASLQHHRVDPRFFRPEDLMAAREIPISSGTFDRPKGDLLRFEECPHLDDPAPVPGAETPQVDVLTDPLWRRAMRMPVGVVQAHTALTVNRLFGARRRKAVPTHRQDCRDRKKADRSSSSRGHGLTLARHLWSLDGASKNVLLWTRSGPSTLHGNQRLDAPRTPRSDPVRDERDRPVPQRSAPVPRVTRAVALRAALAVNWRS